MTLNQFIERVQQSPDLSGSFVCTFQVREHPTLFMSQLYARLKSAADCYATLDAELMPLDALKGQLEMSFLGSRLVYLVKNIHMLDEGPKRSWESYVKKYAGPHTIIYFKVLARQSKSAPVAHGEIDDVRSHQDHERITIALDQVDIQLYQELAQLLYPGIALDSHFLAHLYNDFETISLQDACRMMAYQITVGRKCETFFARWKSRLITSQPSFFTLSQYLFARNPRQFLEQWNRCKGEYPPEFWIAYWSEQLLQALIYVQRARREGMLEAKKGTYRLPFSFLNKDWQKYSPDSLVAAHDALYRFDYNLKHGGTVNGLELWYHRFLNS